MTAGGDRGPVPLIVSAWRAYGVEESGAMIAAIRAFEVDCEAHLGLFHESLFTDGDPMETDEMTLMNEEVPAIASRGALMDRLEGIASDIRALFAEDVEGFASRAVRARFLEGEGFGEDLTDDALRALKAQCASDGVAFRAEVEEKLAPVAVWLKGMGVTDRAGLESVPEIWSVVSAVEARVEAILAEHGGVGAPVRYTAPVRFVGGRYLKTLVEHYWRTIGELEAIESAVQAQERAWSRTALTKRWDAA